MEGSSTRNKLIQAGAYVLFSLGLIVFVALFLAGIALFFYYPDGSLYKKSIVGGAVLVVALIILLLSIAVFESMLELTKVEEAVLELEEKLDPEGTADREDKEETAKEEILNV